jgi:HlyD family secretion protein
MQYKRWWLGKKFLIAAAVVALAAAGGAWYAMRGADTPQYRTATIERGNVTATVSSSGQVMPVTQVSVGSQVSGQIRDLFADFNSEVKAGQLIAQIDPQLIEFQVRQAQADLEAARSQVLIAQANVLASQAAVSRAQVDLAQAERDLGRQRDLVAKGFIAQSEADRAQSLVNTSTEALRGAQAQAKVTAAQVQAAQATVQQRNAALAQAQTNLSRTRITSPVDGIVIKRAVERGQTVAASLQAPELFVIAQNLRDMRVEVSVDESDVGRIKSGQKASFTVDAFPGMTFEGQVDQVRKAPLSANNVVTYVAAVNFANVDGRLLPGMTANVRIVTDARQDVLKVPNAALRVRLPDAEPMDKASDATKNIAQNPQGTKAEAQKRPQSAAGGRLAASGRGRVFVLDANGQPRAVDVRLGLTDGTSTELLPTQDGLVVQEGTSVVVGTISPGDEAPSNGSRRGGNGAGPRLPF